MNLGVCVCGTCFIYFFFRIYTNGSNGVGPNDIICEIKFACSWDLVLLRNQGLCNLCLNMGFLGFCPLKLKQVEPGFDL